MKARMKSTGEIVEISGNCLIRGGGAYIAISELEPLVEETPINWEARRYKLAMAAMQGMLSNSSFDVFRNGFSDVNKQVIVSLSIGYADEAVKQLKGGKL